jgi:VanZ family protein
MMLARGVDTKYWVVAFYTCAVAVLVLATMPTQQAMLLSTGWDKSNHVMAFLVLGLLGLRAHPAVPMRCLLGLFGFGIAIELVQSLLPHRGAEWQDLVADGVGLAIAFGASILARGRAHS